MSIVKIITHVATALGRLLAQFKGKSRIEALVTAFTEQAHGCTTESIEDMFEQLKDDLWLGTAVGAQLDGLGDILDLERSGRDDDDYRLWLRAWILVLRSSGTPEELITIVDLLAPDADSIDLEEQFPAAFVIRLTDDWVWADAQVLADIVGTAKPAGVKFIMEFIPTTGAFAFAGGDASDLGFGDEADPGGVGGSFAGAIEP